MADQPDPHDSGVEVAGRRAAEVAGEGARPIRTRNGHEIRVGTASWTDPTMTAAGVFYPEGATSAEDRLRYYSSRFSLVEVDATYYALPQEQMSQRWVERTYDDFLFDVKAHALMTGQPTETKRLAKPIREAIPEKARDKARVYTRDLPPPATCRRSWSMRSGVTSVGASSRCARRASWAPSSCSSPAGSSRPTRRGTTS